jgi:hypothetical protein
MVRQRTRNLTTEEANAVTLLETMRLIEYPAGRPRKVFFLYCNPNTAIAPAFFRCHCPGPRRHELMVLPQALYDATYEMIGYDDWMVASIHAWRGEDANLLNRWITHMRDGTPCPVWNQ